MGLFTNKDGRLCSGLYKVGENCAVFIPNNYISIVLYESYIEMSSGERKARLPYDSITNVSYNMSHELVQKKKSTVKRSLLGKAVAGDFGASVGAASAAKYDTKKHYYGVLTISYTSSDGSQETLSFVDQNLSQPSHKIIKMIKERADFDSTIML